MDAHQGSALDQIAQDERERGFGPTSAVRDFALEPDGLKHPPFGRHSGGGNSSHRSGLRCWFHVRPLSESRLGNRRRFLHSGEIRRALLKERRERLLGFRGAHVDGEFLVLELYRLLKLFAHWPLHQSLAGPERAWRFRSHLLSRLGRPSEQVLIGHNLCYQSKLRSPPGIEK